MNDSNLKEVQFYIYCKTCKYAKLPENYDPCNECLETGINEESEKPILWEENE